MTSSEVNPLSSKQDPAGSALQRVEDALNKAGMKAGSQGMWQCPSHSDKTPSLSVNQKGAKVLLHCFAGCEATTILAALGLTMADLNDHAVSSKVVARYEYTDPAGIGISRKCRLEPKHFYWEIPGEKNGWTKPKKGEANPHVLYHLPEVIASSIVHLHEGEKAADALREALSHLKGNSSSTCAPTPKWEPAYTEVLHGKSVTIWADRDTTGQKKATKTAKLLIDAGIEVRVVQSRTSGQGDDAYDHLAAGYGPDDGEELDLTELSGHNVPSEKSFALLSAAELIALPEEKHKWLLDGLLLTRGTSLLASPPKVGKSTLTRCLALSVARGKSFLGRQVTQGPVVYLDLEGRKQDLRDSLMAMGMAGTDPIHVFADVWQPDMFEDLLHSIRKLEPALIVVDTMQRFLRLAKINDYDETSNAFDDLVRPLALETGAHVLLLHHENKGSKGSGGVQGVLGSTAIAGGPDTIMMLRREKDGSRVLTSSQRVGENLDGLVVQLDPQTHLVTSPGTPQQEKQMKTEDQILHCLKAAEGWVLHSDLKKKIGGNAAAFQKALESLISEMRVWGTGEGKKGDPHCYTGVDLVPSKKASWMKDPSTWHPFPQSTH